MSTPQELPQDALARARAAHQEMAAALYEDQGPEPDEPGGRQPVWKRPRTPKSKAAKKLELHKQRRRLQDAGKRRLAAGESRRPRPGRADRQRGRAPRCPRPVPGAGLQCLAVVTMPGIAH